MCHNGNWQLALNICVALAAILQSLTSSGTSIVVQLIQENHSSLTSAGKRALANCWCEGSSDALSLFAAAASLPYRTHDPHLHCFDYSKLTWLVWWNEAKKQFLRWSTYTGYPVEQAFHHLGSSRGSSQGNTETSCCSAAAALNLQICPRMCPSCTKDKGAE